jgi:hypothetical protein
MMYVHFWKTWASQRLPTIQNLCIYSAVKHTRGELRPAAAVGQFNIEVESS